MLGKMRTILFLILLAAAIAAYYYYTSAWEPSREMKSPIPMRAIEPSTSSVAVDRATGKTAVDQGMKTRDVLKKVKNSPRQQMPNF